jgi:hypothetical protein
MLVQGHLKYSFFVVFGLLLSWGQATAFANDLGVDHDSETVCGQPTLNDLHDSPRLPHSLPFEGGETPNEPDEEDKTEPNQKTDDNRDQLVSFRVQQLVANIAANQCLLDQIKQALQNRPRVLLFKRYHSWKGLIH